MISNDLHKLGRNENKKKSPGFLLTIEGKIKAIHEWNWTTVWKKYVVIAIAVFEKPVKSICQLTPSVQKNLNLLSILQTRIQIEESSLQKGNSINLLNWA